MARAQARYQLAALRGPQGLEAPLSGNCPDTGSSAYDPPRHAQRHCE
jgi:hypothetical protein